MKTINFIRLFILLFLTTSVAAQQKQQHIIQIKSARVALPLFEKWVTEYTKLNPSVQIVWAGKEADDIDPDIILTTRSHGSGTNVISVGRYALLPVTTKENTYLDVLGKSKLNKKKLADLYFEKDIFDEQKRKKNDPLNHITVYSANSQLSGTSVFASHFGFQPSDLKGKKISGDDIYLLHAIQKDPSGITFNHLAYIANTETRHLKDNIVILPLDIRKEYREVFSSGDIDQILWLLETEKIDIIPIQNLELTIRDEANPHVKKFLSWVLSDGLKYNHSYGFLHPDETLPVQKTHLKELHLSSN